MGILLPVTVPVGQAALTVRRPIGLCSTSSRCPVISRTRKGGGAFRAQASDDKYDVPGDSTEQSVKTEERIGQVSADVSRAPGPSSPALLAGAAIALGVLAFGATRLGGAGPSLAQVASSSTPLEVALANGRPTVVEFYANYCEVCRELAPTTYQVKPFYSLIVGHVCR
jgi:thiol-disulfide isomerase/thioredoxin